MKKPLDKENFKFYVIQNYLNKVNFDIDDFDEDFQRVKYIKKILTRTNETELKYRLLLNHIIIMSNVFGVLPTIRILLFKCNKEHFPQLKAIFQFLNFDSFYNMKFVLDYDSINLATILPNKQLLEKLAKI